MNISSLKSVILVDETYDTTLLGGDNGNRLHRYKTGHVIRHQNVLLPGIVCSVFVNLLLPGIVCSVF
ncbi:hypothetical protein DPMN_034791 [Dreissena polymorpha]|uniref:Uncharacterized protein n=1 Tax=Dreissena polymorpha TaxID=45954 RepID=A0A9D4MAR4_DREPO|nr:hypothetical protein DPMN_034791 [Dreissena polymorpha]